MPKTHKVLIIDDDAELGEALKEQLSLHEEFDAVMARNATDGIQIVRAKLIDLDIMDEAVRILRRKGFSTNSAPLRSLTTKTAFGHQADRNFLRSSVVSVGFSSGKK
jgi:DNA-binding response OmpR family regulator